jgi:hypothetical protein
MSSTREEPISTREPIVVAAFLRNVQLRDNLDAIKALGLRK